MKRRNLQLDARIFGNKSVRPVVTAYWKLTLRIWRDEPLTDVIESSWELDNVEELQFEFQHYFDDTSSFEIRLIRFSEAGELDLIGPREDLRAVEKAYARQWQLNVLPAPFVSLRNLLQVDLTNGAHGPLPEVICELRNLMRLRLNGRNLTSLPPSFANLRELRELQMWSNRFKEFPLVLCELTNLVSLGMGSNQLSKLPRTITRLVHLETLNLSTNSFASFPLFLGDLLQLRYFPSYGNPLRGHQSGLSSVDLLSYLKEQCVILRLATLVASGFYCEQHIDWTRFLFQGVYDPRLFLFIADFLGLLEEETGRKKFRLE